MSLIRRHTFINIDKDFSPKFFKLIASGGNGNTMSIFAHILPLLEKLNRNVLAENVQPFYANLFRNINSGLKSISCCNSGISDIGAIALSYYECLQYVLIQIYHEPNTDANTFCRGLVQEHLIEVIRWCIDNYVNAYKKVFVQIITLLNYWHQKQADTPAYVDLLEYFWKEFYSMLEISLTSDDNSVTEKQLLAYFNLVQVLANKHISRPAITAKVKFDIDTEPTNINVDRQTTDATVAISSRLHESETNELVYRLCKLYMNRIANDNNPTFIVHVENLLSSFNTAELFARLSTKNSIVQFAEKIMVWLLIAQLRQENVVNIILLAYEHLVPTERTAVIGKLLKFPHEEVRVWVLARLLSNPFCKESFVVQMLRDDNVRNVLLKVAHNVVAGERFKENLQFLNKCFYQNDNGDILINRETCEDIVNILAKTLHPGELNCEVADACARFLCEIMPVICSDRMRMELKSFMFLKFFELSLDGNVSWYLFIFCLHILKHI